jgi:hypothetical protein
MRISPVLYRTLVIGVIVLFFGLGVQPAFALSINGVNNPPGTPEIYGPATFKIGVEIDFVFVSTDPDGDNISYYIDWEDDTSDECGPYPSGEQVTLSHTFYEERNYLIRAKAIDHPHGSESDWGEFWLWWRSRSRISDHLIFARYLVYFPLLERLLTLLL